MKNVSDYEGKALVFTKQEDQVRNELYSSFMTEISIKMDDFVNMGMGNFYPGKAKTNEFGSAAGIEFLANVRIETVYGDEIKDSSGNIIRKASGVRCIKQGRRRRVDGTWEKSSPCSYVFNWEDRAELDFLVADEKGNGKYSSALQQRKHILELKKFADQRASTGAELMVIRELTGMPTAFKADQIKKGTVVFSQVGKSQALQTAEAQAVVQNIRDGGLIAGKVNETANLLTGSTGDFNSDFDRPVKTEDPGTIVQDGYTPPSKGEEEDQVMKELNFQLKKVPSQGERDYFMGIFNDNGQTKDVFEWVINTIKEKYPQ